MRDRFEDVVVQLQVVLDVDVCTLVLGAIAVSRCGEDCYEATVMFDLIACVKIVRLATDVSNQDYLPPILTS